ncbi:hypothetical protein LTR48_008972, partial [Friedmanniomyces endolithicus]
IPAMPQQELSNMTELRQREVRGERRLSTLFPLDPETYVRGANHGDVVAAVAYGRYARAVRGRGVRAD